MTPNQQAMFDFVTGLLSMVTSPVVWAWVKPFLVLGVIIRTLKWLLSTVRGRTLPNDMTEIDSTLADIYVRSRKRDTGVQALRAEGLSNIEIRRRMRGF
jgi:hypothetical protein